MKKTEPSLPPVEIPAKAVSEGALADIIDNFILREGTDYGQVDVLHDSKVQQLRNQLTKGEIKIVFDPGDESVSLVTLREWKRISHELGATD